MEDSSLVLTTSGLMTFLAEIEQLNGLDLAIEEVDNGLQISIGDDVYTLETKAESVVEVAPEAIDDIDNIDEEGWDEISDTFNDAVEPVEGGIIKEVLKTLAIGGLVRLTKNAIAKA